jgi:hypothetical protein
MPVRRRKKSAIVEVARRHAEGHSSDFGCEDMNEKMETFKKQIRTALQKICDLMLKFVDEHPELKPTVKEFLNGEMLPAASRGDNHASKK